MPTRAVLFDLDGTLIDSLVDIAHAANHAMAAMGRPTHPIEDYRPMVGDGADVLMLRALGPAHENLASDALRHFKAHYADHLVDHTTVYEGMHDLLDALTARRVAIAVLSNKPDPATRKIVELLLGRHPWAAVAGHKPGIPKKPDPASALAMAGDLGAPPADCLFVGDSHVDMKTAIAARMTPIGVAWGWRTRREMTDAGAAHIIDRPIDLLERL